MADVVLERVEKRFAEVVAVAGVSFSLAADRPEIGKNITAYYRIQGPHLVIEYAPQTLGGDPALHIHTMYRDPTNDYGKGMIKQ